MDTHSKLGLAMRALTVALATVGSVSLGFGQTLIYTEGDLYAVRDDLAGNYVQMADIDLSGYPMSPIGDITFPFVGDYDGNGFSISGFAYDGALLLEDNVGLFGYTLGARFDNVRILDFDVSGFENVGGLIGHAVESHIHDCSVSVTPLGGAQTYVSAVRSAGGLVGKSTSTHLTRCSSAANTHCTDRWSGCLIGHVHLGSSLDRCSASGTATGGNVVGGLTGNLHGSLMTNCRSTSTVSGDMVCGGLVGWIQKDLDLDLSFPLSNCHATGAVSSSVSGLVFFFDPVGNMIFANSATGGLVGWVDEDATITACSSSGTVTGPGDQNTVCGGLLGFANADSAVTNCTSDAAIVGGGTSGGLVGWARGAVQISDCTAYGDTDGVWQSGGLVGAGEHCTITNSHAYGDVHAVGLLGNIHADAGALLAAAGGLVGYTFPASSQAFATRIESSSAHGNVSSTGQMTGGLVGLAWGTLISRSYATGDVSSTAPDIGGLVGALLAPTTLPSVPESNQITQIEDCYATGTINSFSSGAIGRIGGLVGSLRSTSGIVNRVLRSFSVGFVQPIGIEVGGLVGQRGPQAEVTTSYWDMQTSGQTTSDGGSGRTTNQMMQPGTFVGWDFVLVWDILVNSTYPFLR